MNQITELNSNNINSLMYIQNFMCVEKQFNTEISDLDRYNCTPFVKALDIKIYWRLSYGLYGFEG